MRNKNALAMWGLVGIMLLAMNSGLSREGQLAIGFGLAVVGFAVHVFKPFGR